MHLYLYVRGKFEQVELWKAHAQCAYWKWRRINNKTGKEEEVIVQGGLRPSVLGAYEYVFPEEALVEVCKYFGIDQSQSYGFGKIGLETRHFAMRKIFGASKIPKKIIEEAKTLSPTFSTKEFERGCSDCVIPGIGLHVIGIKKDKRGILGEYTQELL